MSSIMSVRYAFSARGLATRAQRAMAVRPSSMAGWIDASAHVHPSAKLHQTATVEAGAYVGPGCELRAGSIVGRGSVIGPGSVLGPHVSVENCRIGAQCILHAGVRIGADGFGFVVDAAWGAVRKKPQLLHVIIGEGVEIGAGTCIDRGSWRDTVVADHTKIDNLVQVGHNVRIGRGCLICAHSALGGSSELGDYCVMGGQSAIADHVSVCAHVRLAARAGVTKHITAAGDYAGFPAQTAASWRRDVAAARRLGRDGTAHAPRPLS